MTLPARTPLSTALRPGTVRGLAALLALGPVTSLHAQQTPEAAPATATTQAARGTPLDLDEVVVVGKAERGSTSAALFTATPLRELPFSVGVYSEDLIEDQRAFSLKEVLQNDPSIAVQMPGGFYGTQNFAARGFRVDNFNGFRLDGLPVIHTVAPVIDDKATVEVLKGPAALRFGFMPPGGAINLVRKRPTADFATSLQFDADTFGSLYSQVDVSDTVADGAFGYRVVVAGDRFDSFYDNADGDRLLGSLYTEWKLGEAATLWSALVAQDYERSGYYGPMITADGVILDTGVKTNIMQDWAVNRHEIRDIALGADIRLGEGWMLRAAVHQQDTGRESLLSYPYSVQDNGDFVEGALLTNGPVEWDSKGGHVHVEGSFSTGSVQHAVVVGAQYRSYTSGGERAFPDVGENNAYDLLPLPIPAVGSWRAIEGDYKERGLFATDTIRFNERFSVLLGIRHGRYETIYPSDPFSNDTVDAWSPTVALMYAPVDNLRTYVTYTRGLQDGGFANRVAVNAWEPLGVQESEQWEAGLKGDWADGRVNGEVAVFQIDQDLAVMDADGVDGFNGLQRHRGLEFALRGLLTEHLQAGVAGMLLDAEQVETADPAMDGKRPQYVPEYQVNLWSELAIPQAPGLALTANARIVDGQYLDQTEGFAIDGYWVLGLGARYGFDAGGSEWILRLHIDNALDEDYYESGEFYAGDAGYLGYGAPRSANVSVTVNF